MNALARFLRLGMDDADGRVAALLSPPDLEPTDRYLKDSAVVSGIDRMTCRLQAWWSESSGGHLVTALRRIFGQSPSNDRAREVGVCVLTAVAAHVTLTILNGVRPGWFWTVIPAMAALFAALLLAGRHQRS
jgi:hypothetical protein